MYYSIKPLIWLKNSTNTGRVFRKTHCVSMDKNSKTVDIVYEDIQVIDFTYLVGEDNMFDVLKPAVVEEKQVN